MSDQPNVAVPAHVVNRIHHKFWTYLLFWSVVAGSALIVPGYGLVYGYSWLDWTMFGILYVISGLGITVGYHRLLTHRSFECPDWVKGALLIAGGWALQNSGPKWVADHLRHHAHCDHAADPYNAQRGFWYSHCGWLLDPVPCTDDRFGSRVTQDRVAMWQHRNYVAIVLAGLALPFVVGYLYAGWQSGLGCFLLAGVGRTFAVLNSTFCINSVCHIWGAQPTVAVTPAAIPGSCPCLPSARATTTIITPTPATIGMGRSGTISTPPNGSSTPCTPSVWPRRSERLRRASRN
ncbi:MAG: fatty acid desaturase [Nitrospiraceae bacterium]